jgi:hypothetical protein
MRIVRLDEVAKPEVGFDARFCCRQQLAAQVA